MHLEHSLLDSNHLRLLAGFALAGPSVPRRAVRAILLRCPSVLYLNFSSGFSSLLGSQLNPSAQKVLWDLDSVSPASRLLPNPQLYAAALKFTVPPPRIPRVSHSSASLLLFLSLSRFLFLGLSAWKTPVHLSRCNWCAASSWELSLISRGPHLPSAALHSWPHVMNQDLTFSASVNLGPSSTSASKPLERRAVSRAFHLCTFYTKCRVWPYNGCLITV